MNRLTCKDTPFEWGLECRKAFEDLKLAFTMAPILTHFDPAKPIVRETDGSNYAITTILSQIMPNNNNLHPIAFHSRSMVPMELNYKILSWISSPELIYKSLSASRPPKSNK